MEMACCPVGWLSFDLFDQFEASSDQSGALLDQLEVSAIENVCIHIHVQCSISNKKCIAITGHNEKPNSKGS